MTQPREDGKGRGIFFPAVRNAVAEVISAESQKETVPSSRGSAQVIPTAWACHHNLPFYPFPSSDTTSPAAVARPGRSNQGTHPSPPPAAAMCQMCCQMCPLPVALQLWAPLHVTAGPITFSALGHDHLPQLPKFLLPCPRNPLLGYKPLNALNTPQISCWLFNHKQSMIFFLPRFM